MKTPLKINHQPFEKPVRAAPAGAIEVVDIWDTIQGEGPLAGTPAVFVRLAGCNLQCPACDTDYTTGRTFYTVKQVVGMVKEKDGRIKTNNIRFQDASPRGWVVLTGGEPFRQPIMPLVKALVEAGYQVQIETNGTLAPHPDEINNHVMQSVIIVCSPKTGQVATALQPWVRCLKYVLRAGEIDPEDGLPLHSVLGNGLRPARPWPFYTGGVCVQPMDEGVGQNEKTKNNAFVAAETAMRFGYTLSLQLHKILGLE